MCHCKRVHFVSGPYGGDFEEGELEGLQESQATEPDKYIWHDETIQICTVFGYEFVPDCPCGMGDRIGSVIENDHQKAAHYISLFINDREKDRQLEERLDVEAKGQIEGALKC